MRRLIYFSVGNCLVTSWRTFLNLSHPAFSGSEVSDPRTLRAVRHSGSARVSNAADDSNDRTAYSSQGSDQKNYCNLRCGGISCLPTPSSIGGTPFTYLLQRIILHKTEASYRELRCALQFLCNVATTDSTVPVHSNALKSAESREQRMSVALVKASSSFRQFDRHWGRGPGYSLCLQPPDGHVCAPAVVGEVYLFLRSLGVDVATWWNRYYHAFVRPNIVKNPGVEGVAAATAALGSELDSGATTLGTEDVGFMSGVKDSTLPPPFYWTYRRVDTHAGSSPTFTGSGVESFAVPLPSFDEPARSQVTAEGDKLDMLWRKKDMEPIATCELAVSLAKPQVRQSVWIPAHLIHYLPYFPAPLPLPNSVDEREEVQSGVYRRDGTALASAAFPPVWCSNDSCMVEENERSRPVCCGETDGLFFLQDPSPVTESTDSDLNECKKNSCGASTAWLTPRGSTTILPQHAEICARQGVPAEEQWALPLYDALDDADDTSSASLQKPTWIFSSGAKASVSLDTAAQGQAWRHPQVVGEPFTSSFSLMDFTRTPVMPSTIGSLPAPAAGQWPPHLSSQKVQSFHQAFFSRVGTTKYDPMDSIRGDYSFPLQAYPLLRYHALLRGRTRSAATPAWGAPQYGWGGAESLPRRKSPTTERGEANYKGDVSGPARRSIAFSLLLDNAHLKWVRFFGVTYLSVDATALSCLFDSTTCVRNAVPLNVAGNVFLQAMAPTRFRQQCWYLPTGTRCRLTSERHNHGAVIRRTEVSEREGTPGLPFFETAMRKLEAAEASVRSSRGSQDTIPATTDGGSAFGPNSGVSPWLVRLREIRDESRTSKHNQWVSRKERVQGMRSPHREAFFLFRSPYWVEVTELYERWGVQVTTGTVPLHIDGESYVNAEQTTDASRFTPSTCVPHLKQEVLFDEGLETCSWAGSQRLLRQIAPDAVPPRRPDGVCAWGYDTLCARAAAVQRVSNLWIEESLVEKFQWTTRCVAALRPRDQADSRGYSGRAGGPDDEVFRAVLTPKDFESCPARKSPPAELHSKAVHLEPRLRGGSFYNGDDRMTGAIGTAPWSISEEEGTNVTLTAPSRQPTLSSRPPAVVDGLSASPLRPTAKPRCSVVHSSCIVEQEELEFVAGYSPRLLLLRVPDLMPEDLACGHLNCAKVNTSASHRLANTLERNSDRWGDGVSGAAGVYTERRISQGEGTNGKSRDGDVAFVKDYAECGGATLESGSPSERATLLRRIYAMKRKRALFSAPWRGAKLSFQSRLALASLALRNGYRGENADRWVSLDVLHDEPRSLVGHTSLASPGVHERDVGVTQISSSLCVSPSTIAGSTPRQKAASESTCLGIPSIDVVLLLPPRRKSCPSSLDADEVTTSESIHVARQHGGGGRNDPTPAAQTRTVTVINYKELRLADELLSSTPQLVWRYV